MRYLLLLLPLLLSLLPFSAHSIQPTLINGTPSNPSDWPASIYIKSGSASCSATLISPNTIITAAHCVISPTISFTLGPNQYKATCTKSPHYNFNYTADYALCLTHTTVPTSSYESISTNPDILDNQNTLLLTGYGCTRPGGGGGNDGVFRTSTATIVATPRGSSNDITTKGGAALCFGDSGGAAYLDTKHTRLVVGINSRGDIYSKSDLSALFTPQATSFINDWLKDNPTATICGINHTNCNNHSPPQPDEFEIIHEYFTIKGRMNDGHQHRMDDIAYQLEFVIRGIF